jgi:hypothetical protein
MKYCSKKLCVHRDRVFVLRTQKLFSAIELPHSPDSWNHDCYVGLCNLTDLSILMDSNQNCVCERENENNRDHDTGDHKPSSVMKDPTLSSLLPSKTFSLTFIFTQTISSRDKGFQSSIKPLHYSESQNIDKHVTHSYPCN